MKKTDDLSYIDALKKRAKNQDVIAMYLLGITYEEGRGVSIDLEKALNWYEKAAESGDVYAQVNLASILRGESAYEEMAVWLSLAAEQNHVKAQFQLGYCYEIGLGLEVDYSQAESWYGRAADKGHCEALFRLGYLHHRSLSSCPDQFCAIRYFRRAAKQGHLAATAFLGDYYENGRVVFRDYVKAANFYRTAAEGGLPAAQFCLGQMMQFGMGVEKSEKDGAYWISEAAEQGFIPALYLRSLLCLKGFGVSKSLSAACMWLLVARELDSGMSHDLIAMKEELESECKSLASEEQWKIAAERAVQWLDDFSGLESKDGKFFVGF